MTDKWHIDVNGIAVECKAVKRNCPRGGNQEHYSSKEEANIYADFLNEIDAKLSLTKSTQQLTEKQASQRAKEVEKILNNPLIERFDTKNFYYDEISGTWDDEREELHREIIDEILLENVNVPNDKKVVISAGLPGAGKTTVLNDIPEINPKDYITINADDIKEKLIEKGMAPQIKGLTPLETAGLIHEESSKISDQLQLELAKQGKNVIYDMTSKSRRSVDRRLVTFVNHGYKLEDVTMVFVDIDIETSKDRALNRYTNGINGYIAGENSMGGRYVPEKVFESCKPTWKNSTSRNQEVFKTIQMDKSFPIRTIEYNNNVNGRKPIRIS